MENLTDYFLNTIVNINFLGDLKFEITEHYPEKLLQESLNKKLKLMGGAMKYFLKKLLGHEVFRPMVSWATKIFLKNL